jgi:hypothetical protein
VTYAFAMVYLGVAAIPVSSSFEKVNTQIMNCWYSVLFCNFYSCRFRVTTSFAGWLFDKK